MLSVTYFPGVKVVTFIPVADSLLAEGHKTKYIEKNMIHPTAINAYQIKRKRKNAPEK